LIWRVAIVSLLRNGADITDLPRGKWKTLPTCTLALPLVLKFS
jgi:hypothetical protein